MSEKRLDYDLLWNNYYQVIELDDGDSDYLRRLSPTEIIKRLNEQQSTISSLQTELELTANTKLFSRKELERKVEEQQAEIERLQKIIDLTNYQLKVQDRIIQMEEKE